MEKTTARPDTSEQHIDVHCHVFNEDILSWGIRLILNAIKIGEIANFLDLTHIDRLLGDIERYIHFIDIGLKGSTEKVFKTLQKNYKERYVLAPLMLDLSYVSGKVKTHIHDSFKGEDDHKVHHHLRNAIENFSTSVKDKSGKLSEEHNRKLQDLDTKTKTLHSKVEEFSSKQKTFKVFDKRNFEKQLKQLKKLKRDHDGIVYPFLSVDPRKKDILDIVKNEVGEGKDFIGIKLYAPLGYSPTDPLLYGTSDTYQPYEDCLYNYCIINDIPITAHNSDSGFATFTNSVKIHGHIYNEKINSVEYVDRIVRFNNKVDIRKFKFEKGWIEERASVLNHPKIWLRVMRKFNKLRLNLAHFGGAQQIAHFIDFKEGGSPDYNKYSWAETIFSMLKRSDFINFYTDLSCFKEVTSKNNKEDEQLITLKMFKENIFDPNSDIQGKILYGSDYYLNMIFMDSFNEYLNNFKNGFKDKFETISKHNCRSFLNLDSMVQVQ